MVAPSTSAPAVRAQSLVLLLTLLLSTVLPGAPPSHSHCRPHVLLASTIAAAAADEYQSSAEYTASHPRSYSVWVAASRLRRCCVLGASAVAKSRSDVAYWLIFTNLMSRMAHTRVTAPSV